MKIIFYILFSLLILSGCGDTEDDAEVASTDYGELHYLSSTVEPSLPPVLDGTYYRDIVFETTTDVSIIDYGDLNPNNVSFVNGVFSWDAQIDDVGEHTIILADNYNNTQSLTINIASSLVNFTGNWVQDTSVYYADGESFKSAGISNSQSSCTEIAITGVGTLSYYWKVSSESGYDYLRFYYDDVEQSGKISGEVDWTLQSWNVIESGEHTYKWCYTKDGSSFDGNDAGWIDQVIFQ